VIFQKFDLRTLGQSNNPHLKSFVYKFSINFECPGLFLETSNFFCPYMYGSDSLGLILLSLTNKIVMASAEPIRMKQFFPITLYESGIRKCTCFHKPDACKYANDFVGHKLNKVLPEFTYSTMAYKTNQRIDDIRILGIGLELTCH